MHTFRILIASSCLLVGAAWPAVAQSAPIREGVTSAEIAERTQALQRENADLRLKISDLRRDNSQLTGKVQTLEFLLSQTRDEINRMQGDDKEIGRQLSQIQTRLDTMQQAVSALEDRAAGESERMVTVRSADGSVTRRLVRTAQPDTTDMAPGDASQAAPQDGSADASPAGEVAGDGATSPDDSPPRQTGSLGTISAEDLPGEAGDLFSEAKSRLLQFDYPGAEVAFRAFLEAFGDDPQAGEAQYWLGEVLYQQDQYEASGAAYTQMIQSYPDDPRAPDALVKLARSMRLVGDTNRACAALNLLPRKYPEASSVTLNLAAVENNRSSCAG